MKERGSALLTAVIFVMVLLSISGILLTTVTYQAKNESSEEKGLRAYYLAEAGIQYGIALGIRATADGSLVEGVTISPSQVNDPFGQGGWFKVTVAREVGATSFTVKSTGNYSETRRIKKAEYEFGEQGGDSDDDNDHDNDNDDDNDNNNEYCNDDVNVPLSAPWIYDKYYEKGSKVSYQEKAFYARENTRYQQPGIPGYFWQEITKKWTTYNWYKQYDIVCYNGIKYLARENMMQPGTYENIPGEVKSGNTWQELTDQWTKFNSYKQNSFVFYLGKLFFARENMQYPVTRRNVPGEIKEGNTWQEMTDQWTEFNSYKQNDIVYYNGKLFIARQNMQMPVTQRNVPGVADTWKELTYEWRSYNYYNQGDIVLYNDQWFKAEGDAHPGTVPDPTNIWGVWRVIAAPPAPVLKGIFVYPIHPSIQVGETQTFTATAIYSNGTTVDVSAQATWTTSNSTVIVGWFNSNESTVTMEGRVVTAHSAGLVTGTSPIPIATSVSIPVPITIPIKATFQGKAGTAYLTVAGSTNSDPDPEPDPDPDPGTGTGRLLWEKEVIE